MEKFRKFRYIINNGVVKVDLDKEYERANKIINKYDCFIFGQRIHNIADFQFWAIHSYLVLKECKVKYVENVPDYFTLESSGNLLHMMANDFKYSVLRPHHITENMDKLQQDFIDWIKPKIENGELVGKKLAGKNVEYEEDFTELAYYLFKKRIEEIR